MDNRTARKLIELDNRFYTAHASSFSATRQAPWPGWRRVVRIAREEGALGACGNAGDLARSGGRGGDRTARPARVLDIACGNLRFERFLADEARRDELGPLEFHAIDACEPLAHAAPPIPGLAFHRADALTDLLDGRDPFAGIPRADLVACFGFMHHVPGERLRGILLAALLRAAAPAGVIALSFWQFMHDERLARKAREADARATVEPREAGIDPDRLDRGDHFLGWQDDPHALRYCHHFDEDEIDGLVSTAAADCPGTHEVARFSADGRDGGLNRYLVLKTR